MNFFKSVFPDDPAPSDSPNAPTSPPNSQSEDHEEVPEPSSSTTTNAWSFGGLIETLASKSESVIETYRRDLGEFGSGLRKETAVIREVAGRAVRELPASVAAAQESLESVGQAIDHIGNSVSEIISHGNDCVLAGDFDIETSNSKHVGDDQKNLNLSSRLNSRFDVQIRAIQCDLNTYCEEPENLEDYNEWKQGFKLGEKGGEIEDLIEENGLIEEIYNEVVPSRVDWETFWSRYFYWVCKVTKAEEARAKLVKRAISGQDEGVLSWDVDDDDYKDSDGSKLMNDSKKIVERSNIEGEEKSSKREKNEKGVVSESKSDNGVNERVHLDGSESSGSKLEAKSDELGLERKTKNCGSCKERDFSVVSTQPSVPEEEDFGWDIIEDIGSIDGIKVTTSGSPNRADFGKRPSVLEEEEDLSWDIEDYDEPVQ